MGSSPARHAISETPGTLDLLAERVIGREVDFLNARRLRKRDGHQQIAVRGHVSTSGAGQAGIDHPVDEAHSVAIRTPAGGLIVAAGSVQWSWALDAYGAHTDPQGNQTPVDSRLQSLTRNLMNALRGRVD